MNFIKKVDKILLFLFEFSKKKNIGEFHKIRQNKEDFFLKDQEILSIESTKKMPNLKVKAIYSKNFHNKLVVKKLHCI